MSKPSLLIISHVLPLARISGQQQRVYYTLKAIREFFKVSILVSADSQQAEDVRNKLLDVCDEAIVLPSNHSKNLFVRTWNHCRSLLYIMRTGLKKSNYVIAKVEFTPKLIKELFESKNFDCVLLEYWHAANSMAMFRKKNTPCVLDTHGILWQSYGQYLSARPNILAGWKPAVYYNSF